MFLLTLWCAGSGRLLTLISSSNRWWSHPPCQHGTRYVTVIDLEASSSHYSFPYRWSLSRRKEEDLLGLWRLREVLCHHQQTGRRSMLTSSTSLPTSLCGVVPRTMVSELFTIPISLCTSIMACHCLQQLPQVRSLTTL